MAGERKRFKANMVSDLYRQVYSCKFSWDQILDANVNEYFQYFSKAYNCPMTNCVGCIFPLVAAICGPDTKVQVIADHYKIPLNTYLMLITAPGGGKSVLWKHIIEQTADGIKAEDDTSILVESYSTAGLQRHQQENNGRILLTSDEGQRILSSINAKQALQQAEKSLLSKLWEGSGDFSTLLEKDRGFKKTAFSMFIMIQPEPAINELCAMGIGSNDGFMDRMLFVVGKPHLYSSQEMTENAVHMERTYEESMIPSVMQKIYNYHKEGTYVYKFSADSQTYYNDINNDHVEQFNNLYPSDGNIPKFLIYLFGKVSVLHVINVNFYIFTIYIPRLLFVYINVASAICV